MPKRLTEISVFISYPSDLQAERKVVEAAIEEVSSFLKETHGVVLNSVTWEKNVVPGVGPDPQAVIDDQLVGKYDIYLGLLGSRFGTETPRAGSGTEEEFELAYRRYTESPQALRVLFYFKTTAENIHRIDLKQLEKVHSFRKKLQEKGVLFHDFASQDDLLKVLKEHLKVLIIEQWDTDHWKASSLVAVVPRASLAATSSQNSAQLETLSDPLTQQEQDESEEDEACGILDAIVSSESAVGVATQSLARITGLSDELGTKTLERAQMLSHAKGLTARQVMDIVDLMADDLAGFSSGLEKETLTLEAAMGQMLSSLQTAITIYLADCGNPEMLAGLPAALDGLSNGMRQGRDGTDSMRKQLEELPRFTAKFRKAKRRAQLLLANFSGLITVYLDKIEDIKRHTPSHPRASKSN